VLKKWGQSRAGGGLPLVPGHLRGGGSARPARGCAGTTAGRRAGADLVDFTARIAQHELDHLDGVTLWHRMSPVDRIRWRRELDELSAQVAGATRARS
jgi:hypothetical protein